MKKYDFLILLVVSAFFGFFIATAKDRARYVISILPVIAVIILAFRQRKS